MVATNGRRKAKERRANRAHRAETQTQTSRTGGVAAVDHHSFARGGGEEQTDPRTRRAFQSDRHAVQVLVLNGFDAQNGLSRRRTFEKAARRGASAARNPHGASANLLFVAPIAVRRALQAVPIGAGRAEQAR